jgi:hypothetical protein
MLKLNTTLHEAMLVSEQQGNQNSKEQSQSNVTAGHRKHKSTSSVIKPLSQALYLWMD